MHLVLFHNMTVLSKTDCKIHRKYSYPQRTAVKKQKLIGCHSYILCGIRRVHFLSALIYSQEDTNFVPSSSIVKMNALRTYALGVNGEGRERVGNSTRMKGNTFPQLHQTLPELSDFELELESSY